MVDKTRNFGSSFLAVQPNVVAPKGCFLLFGCRQKKLKSANFCKSDKTSYFLVSLGKNSVDVETKYSILDSKLKMVSNWVNPKPGSRCSMLSHFALVPISLEILCVIFFLGYHGYLKVFIKEPSAQGGSTSPR